MTYAAYAAVQQASETPRDLEIRAVADVTHKLELAERQETSPGDRVKAIYWNSRMWQIFVNDLVMPENELPPHLRASYISLGLFVQRESVTALAGRRSLSAFIAINRDLLDALSCQGRDDDASSDYADA